MNFDQLPGMNDPMKPVNGLISDPIRGGCYKPGIDGKVFGMNNELVGRLSPSGDRIDFLPEN